MFYAHIADEVKKWKFDTIAVHGLYSVQDAINDYQGAIIEPIFMRSSQAYRDSDEMAAALAYKITTWCYSRIANPSTYYYEWTLALLEGYGFDGVRVSQAQTDHIGLAHHVSRVYGRFGSECDQRLHFRRRAIPYGNIRSRSEQPPRHGGTHIA